MTVERGAVFQDTGPPPQGHPPTSAVQVVLTTLVAAMLLDPLSPFSLSHRVGLGKGPSWGPGH